MKDEHKHIYTKTIQTLLFNQVFFILRIEKALRVRQ